MIFKSLVVSSFVSVVGAATREKALLLPREKKEIGKPAPSIRRSNNLLPMPYRGAVVVRIDPRHTTNKQITGPFVLQAGPGEENYNGLELEVPMPAM